MVADVPPDPIGLGPPSARRHEQCRLLHGIGRSRNIQDHAEPVGQVVPDRVGHLRRVGHRHDPRQHRRTVMPTCWAGTENCTGCCCRKTSGSPENPPPQSTFFPSSGAGPPLSTGASMPLDSRPRRWKTHHRPESPPPGPGHSVIPGPTDRSPPGSPPAGPGYSQSPPGTGHPAHGESVPVRETQVKWAQGGHPLGLDNLGDLSRIGGGTAPRPIGHAHKNRASAGQSFPPLRPPRAKITVFLGGNASKDKVTSFFLPYILSFTGVSFYSDTGALVSSPILPGRQADARQGQGTDEPENIGITRDSSRYSRPGRRPWFHQRGGPPRMVATDHRVTGGQATARQPFLKVHKMPPTKEMTPTSPVSHQTCR